MASSDMISKAFGIVGNKEKDVYRFGRIASVNADGTAEVIVGTNANTTCRCLYTPHAGDRVQVCIKSSGKGIVLGKV